VAVADVVVGSDLGTAAAADIGVTAGDVVQVDQAETSTASNTTVTLGTTLKHLLTGTTPVEAFNGVAGNTYSCTADEALPLVYDAANLILPSSDNIICAAGDTFDVYMVDADSAVVINFQRASGAALVASSGLDMGTYTATTSGTAINITGLQADLKRLTIPVDGVSTNGTSDLIIQIGDIGGIATSGYSAQSWVSNTTNQTDTTGFCILPVGAAANLTTGVAVIYLTDPATNLYEFTFTGNAGGSAIVSSGKKALSGALDRFTLTTIAGTDTFDDGAINWIEEL
jgi:hypothetical protein